jgi:hypothetical protein
MGLGPHLSGACINSEPEPIFIHAICCANQARIVNRYTKDTIMNEPEYIAGRYVNNQTSMEDYLEAMRKLKETFLKGKTGTALPVVP